MSRIQDRFSELSGRGVAGLIPFITAGDPEPQYTVPLMQALVAGGANLLELGVPFSDPMADGKVIQRSSERALKFNVSLDDVLQMVSRFRQQDMTTPVILMGYLNPIEAMGYATFCQRAGDAGVDGLVTVDLPPEEGGALLTGMRARAIDPIFLLSPTTSDQRAKLICDAASGFVYYVSLKGVTGANKLDIDDVERHLRRIRRVTELPIGVGFGIKDPESAARVAKVSDAVVIGSTLVERLNKLASEPSRMLDECRQFIHSIRVAMDHSA